MPPSDDAKVPDIVSYLHLISAYALIYFFFSFRQGLVYAGLGLSISLF